MLFCDILIHHYHTITHFFQVPPFAHYIIYLGAFSATFICHPVFIFLLSVDNHQIPPFLQNSQSLILPYFLFQHCTSSLFSHPLCFLFPHVHLGPHLELSSPVLIHFLSTHPGLPKIIFFLHAVVNLWSIRTHIFRMNCFTSSFMAISLSDTLFTYTTLSTSFSLTTIPIPFFFHPLHCKIVCIHLQCSLLYSLSALFPVGTICLLLCSIKSASSLPLPVIVPIFKVPTLVSEHLPFHTSCCLFTHLPPLFLLLFLLCSSVA